MSDVNQKLFKIISEQLEVGLEKVVPSAHFIDDLGADSLDTVELIMAIEEGMDMEIDDSEAENFQTVQEVLDFISAAVEA